MRASIAPWPVAFAALLAAQAPPPEPPAPDLTFNCSYTETPGGGRLYYDLFAVFFDLDSAAITAAAARTLDNVVSAYERFPHCAIMIAAHADRSGSAAHNEALAGRRAKSVSAYLRGRGIRSELVIENHGESRPLVETPDGVRERQNRRAEIVVGPPRARQ